MKDAQRSFVFRRDKRGGARAGAGRPKKAGRGNVPHRARRAHDESWPVLVTLRAKRGLPSFRHDVVLRMLRDLLEAQPKRIGTSFRVPHFSIQSDHVHLIVEAENGALNRGIRSFIIRFARQVNRLLRRKGSVWGDRYHRRDLGSPTEIKNALNYVLNNDLKHGHRKASLRTEHATVDGFSSASLLDGWCVPTLKFRYAVPWPVTMKARTWGLREGWLLCGPLDPRKKPGTR